MLCSSKAADERRPSVELAEVSLEIVYDDDDTEEDEDEDEEEEEEEESVLFIASVDVLVNAPTFLETAGVALCQPSHACAGVTTNPSTQNRRAMPHPGARIYMSARALTHAGE
jgi:hypothetical protein